MQPIAIQTLPQRWWTLIAAVGAVVALFGLRQVPASDVVGGCDASSMQLDQKGGEELALPDGGALVVDHQGAITRVNQSRQVRCTWEIRPRGARRTWIRAVIPDGPRFLALLQTDGALRMPGIALEAQSDSGGGFAGVFGWRHEAALVTIDPDHGPIWASKLGASRSEFSGLWALPGGDRVVFFDDSLSLVEPSGRIRWKRALGDVLVNDVRPEAEGLLVMTEWAHGNHGGRGTFLGLQHRDRDGELTAECGYRDGRYHSEPNDNRPDAFDHVSEIIDGRVFALGGYDAGFWFRCVDGAPRDATRFLDPRSMLLLVTAHHGDAWVVYRAHCSVDAPNGAGIYVARLAGDHVERPRLVLSDEDQRILYPPETATVGADGAATFYLWPIGSVTTAPLWED